MAKPINTVNMNVIRVCALNVPSIHTKAYNNTITPSNGPMISKGMPARKSMNLTIKIDSYESEKIIIIQNSICF